MAIVTLDPWFPERRRYLDFCGKGPPNDPALGKIAR